MKQLIMDVLEDMSGGQVNLASEVARRTVANTITAALKTKGSYKEYTVYELEEQEARKVWVCEICGKSTFEVEDDYIGSGTNHLGCELKLELEEPVQTEDGEYVEVEMREKNWLQKKHEDKVFGGDTGIDADFGYDDIPEGLKRAKELSQEAIKEGMKSSYKK